MSGTCTIGPVDDVTEENERAYRGLEDLAKLAEGAARAAPAEGDIRPYYVGRGLLAAAHRQAAAVVLLHRHGLGHEGAPTAERSSSTWPRSGGWPKTVRTPSTP